MRNSGGLSKPDFVSRMKMDIKVPRFLSSRPAFPMAGVKRLMVPLLILFLGFIPLRTAYHIAVNNAGSEALWFDEALDFWISQGVNPFEMPFQSHGSWLQVQKVNAALEASPGLHIILLRLASYFGNAAWKLRISSYLFFILTCVLLAALVHAWSGSALLTVFALSFAFSFPQLLWNSLELKPYILEACGVVAGWAGLEFALKTGSPRRFLFLGILLAVFSATRYSYLIYAGIILTFASFEILRSAQIPHRKPLFMLWWPCILSFVLIFGLSLYWQGFVSTPISCTGPILKTQIAWFYRPFILANKPWTEMLAQILKNLAGPAGWPLGAFMGLWWTKHISRSTLLGPTG